AARSPPTSIYRRRSISRRTSSISARPRTISTTRRSRIEDVGWLRGGAAGTFDLIERKRLGHDRRRAGRGERQALGRAAQTAVEAVREQPLRGLHAHLRDLAAPVDLELHRDRRRQLGARDRRRDAL